MSLAMYRMSVESSRQSTCDKNYLLSFMHGIQSDNKEQYGSSQYKPCFQCASRTRQVLTVVPWILCFVLFVCLVAMTTNQIPQECVKEIFWRELEFGILPFLIVYFGSYSLYFCSYCLHLLVLNGIWHIETQRQSKKTSLQSYTRTNFRLVLRTTRRIKFIFQPPILHMSGHHHQNWMQLGKILYRVSTYVGISVFILPVEKQS
jgi:hypothetical protein